MYYTHTVRQGSACLSDLHTTLGGKAVLPTSLEGTDTEAERHPHPAAGEATQTGPRSEDSTAGPCVLALNAQSHHPSPGQSTSPQMVLCWVAPISTVAFGAGSFSTWAFEGGEILVGMVPLRPWGHLATSPSLLPTCSLPIVTT